MKEYLDEKLHEECGVFGMYDRDGHDVVATAYYALYALQHRGQESCGIAVNDGGVIYKRRELGLVNEVFTKDVLDACLLYTSPSPRDRQKSRMPSSA